MQRGIDSLLHKSFLEAAKEISYCPHYRKVEYGVGDYFGSISIPETVYGWYHMTVPIKRQHYYTDLRHTYCVGVQWINNYNHVSKLLLLYKKLGIVRTDNHEKDCIRACRQRMFVRRKTGAYCAHPRTPFYPTQ